MSGYVKIHRKITEWEWYGDLNTRVVFLHLIFTANWKDGRFKGIDIPRGSLVTSARNLAEEVGLSIRQTRTALEHLQSTNEVTIKGHGKFSVVEIKNYDEYQATDKQEVNEATNSRQTESQSDDEQPTTIEEYKNKKNKESKNNNTSCTEPKDSEPEADVELIPLNDGSDWRPTMTLYAEYVRLYPNVDVKQQFRAMRAWCLANPTKQKTRRGIKKFVGGWLDREQNRNRGKPYQPQEPPREEMSVARARFLQEHPEIDKEEYLSAMSRDWH